VRSRPHFLLLSLLSLSALTSLAKDATKTPAAASTPPAKQAPAATPSAPPAAPVAPATPSAAISTGTPPATTPAADNPYDTLGKVLVPLITLMGKSPAVNHALTANFVVEESKGFDPDLAGQHGTVYFEPPERIKIEAPLYGESITLCRRGSRVWAWPGSKLKALLVRPDITPRLPVPDRKYQLKPFALPLSEKQMLFFPALFQAHSSSPEKVNDAECQVIDAEITPFVAATLGLDGWSGRMWVSPEHTLARLRLQGPDTAITMRMDKMDYGKTLPASTWVASKAQQEDLVLVPPARYDQLVRAYMGSK
jgi:hypothetical protein